MSAYYASPFDYIQKSVVLNLNQTTNNIVNSQHLIFDGYYIYMVNKFIFLLLPTILKIHLFAQEFIYLIVFTWVFFI